MKKAVLFSVLLCALACTFSFVASAQGNAMVYAVHGIPGTALGGATSDLPVDVAVNGACVGALEGFNFGEIRGPLSLPAPSTYVVEIKPADPITPCSQGTLLSRNVDVTPGLNASLVAHLDQFGNPTISVFVNDISATRPGSGRLLVHHTAQAPSVDVSVYRGQGRGKVPTVSVPGFTNAANGGSVINAEFRPGNWNATLSVGGDVVFGPATLNLEPNTAQLVFAIGEFPGTFRLITKTIPTMKR